MWYERLPHLNVALNALSAVLLAWGWGAIRRKRQKLHARLMLGAFASSTLFLASYLTYHALKEHTVYPGRGLLRGAYLAVLFSHVVLAMVNLPLVLRTLYLAWRQRFDSHRRLARWTLPIWLYVSVTGVIVYVMLYVFPPAA
jgi:putative membrane protein